MHLTQREQEKLLLVVAADLARKRLDRGLKLNYPEAVALISAEIMEAARDGKSVAEIMAFGTTILSHEDVIEGTAEMLAEVQVEATFPDGTKLVTVHSPIRSEGEQIRPGEYLLGEGEIKANVGRATTTLLVSHTGDRPVQVGSHYHFFEVNEALAFARERAYGMRLNIPAGTAVRFEPGEEKEVALVALGGYRAVYGHTSQVNGLLASSPTGESGASQFGAEAEQPEGGQL